MKYILDLINNSIALYSKNKNLKNLDESFSLLGTNSLEIKLYSFCVFEDDKNCFTVETGNSTSPSGLAETKYNFISFVYKDGNTKTMFKQDFFEKIKPYVKQKEEAFFYMNKEFNAMAIRAKAKCIEKITS
jgi:hypothetical protein